MFQAIRTIIRIRSAIGKSPFNGNGDVKGKDTDGYLGNIAIVFLFFLTLSGVSAFTMFTTSALFIDVWANLLIAMGLLIVAQRIILQRLGTFRTVHNKLRAKVGEFSQENDKLHNEIDNLEIESSKLADVEKGFAEVASTMGTEVEHLERVTDEYDVILEETKSYQKTRLIQDVMRVVLKASGENLTIDNKSEIDRLKIFLRGIPGVHFNEEKFVLTTEEKLTVPDLMEMFRSLQNGSDSDEEENIFILAPEELKASDYDKKRKPLD